MIYHWICVIATGLFIVLLAWLLGMLTCALISGIIGLGLDVCQ